MGTQTTLEEEKAIELKIKFGNLAIDVVKEVLDTIKDYDNSMLYEINFWTKVGQIIKFNN